MALSTIYYGKHVGLSQWKIPRSCLELVITFGLFSLGFYKTLAHGVLKYYNGCFYVLHHDNNLCILLCGHIYTTEIILFSGKFSNSFKIRLYGCNRELNYPLSNQPASKEKKSHSIRSKI